VSFAFPEPNKVIGSFSVVSHPVEHLVNLARVPKSENHSKSAHSLPVFLQIVAIAGFLLLHARLRTEATPRQACSIP
jgi:hypothetical protein